MILYRSLIVGFFGLALLFATHAKAWSPTELASSHRQTLKIDFGVQTPEGVILQKDQKNGHPYYTFSLFVLNKQLNTTVVPKTIFEQKYDKFRTLYQSILQRHRGLACISRVAAITRLVDDEKPIHEALCREDFQKNTDHELALWREDINKIVNR